MDLDTDKRPTFRIIMKIYKGGGSAETHLAGSSTSSRSPEKGGKEGEDEEN